MDNPCRCDYVWISEPPYEDVSGTPFCGLYAPITYRSSTRTLSITLLYSQSHKHAFTLEYTAERNRLHLKGTELMTGGAKGLNSTGGGILTSPFFPARYPRDLGLEYIITCPNEAPSCRIRLLFSDFQLATVSIMEFYDWNGQRLDVSSGARFRPPVIVSSGPSLLIRFYANGGTGLGYKAFYSFVIGHLFDKSIQPITDCGGYVENLGGAITMMDMVGEGVKTYDCVWLIRPPKNFLHMKTHMYLKVVTFADMAGNTELVIKQGPTSALLPLEIFRHPSRQLQPPRHREHIAPVISGFHVSLRGTFGPSSHLAIAYAAFSYMDCFAGSDFLCQNHRCIPTQLNCDGFDHCGDNSDEPTTCFRDWEVEPRDRKWHTNKPNYYFPKIDRYPDLKTATLVFVASSLGLIVLISALIILLYRMGARARQQRELQSRLQTISELLDGARIDEISVSDDPPVYEAPPGYEEVVKLGLEVDGAGRKKRRSISREPRSRRSPSQCSLDLGQSSACVASECASTSRGSQTTPIPSTEKQSRPVPESPPPPYVTPPGSICRRLGILGLRSSSGLREPVVCRGAAERQSQRWLRRENESSRSVQGNNEASNAREEAVESSESSVLDAEELGAYPQDPVASGSISTAESDPQPGSSPDALTDITLDCEQGPEHVTEQEPGQAEGRIEVEATPELVVDKIEPSVSINCSCEGACGCANDLGLASTSDQIQEFERNISDENEGEMGEAFESIPDNREILEEDEHLKIPKRGEDEESSYSKNSIIRLLGGRSGKLQGNGSTNASTAASTPYGSFRGSSRKYSVCSKDSHATKISTISSCNSYEKLQDEFEIVSEAASIICHTNPSTLANTPSETPRRMEGQRRRSRRYSSCDLESLYEGIRVLDGFLLRRGGLPATHGRKQSVTAVMLFGTPEHGAYRLRRDRNFDHEGVRIRGAARIWRSSEDTLSN